MEPNDQFPDDLARELRGLLPDPPQALSAREQEILARAHVVIRRGNGRRIGAWSAGIAAAAALLIGVAIWQVSAPAPSRQVATMQQTPPTIVNALRAARKPGAQQAEVDQIAMAAVQLSQPEVQ